MEKFAIAVKAFIVDNGNLLILKRRPNDAHRPSQWDIPGGRLAAGEDPFVGLEREVWEEAKIKLKIGQPLTVQHFTRDDGQIITMIVFICEPITRDVILSDEHTEYQWINIGQAQVPGHAWLEGVMTDYKNLQLRAKAAIPSSA